MWARRPSRPRQGLAKETGTENEAVTEGAGDSASPFCVSYPCPPFQHRTGLCVLFYFAYRGIYNSRMPRKLVWIATPRFEGFGCSECNWMFQSSTQIAGESLDELKQAYESERNEEFSPQNWPTHPKPTPPENN